MDQICPYCQAASWDDEIPSWCCDKGKTDLAQSESNIDPDPIEELRDGREEQYDGHETRDNDEIDENVDAINKILYSVRPGTTNLTSDCKAYRLNSVQYNNAVSMASQQVTLDHSVAPYTCKVQGAITTHMPALAPEEGEKSVFGQIYIMDSTQD